VRRDEPDARDSSGELIQLATFHLGGAEYAIDIMLIREIIQPQKITPVPRAPAFIEGVIELRGAILPVVDLRKRFDLPAPPPVRATKYIIVLVDGRTLGLVVDSVGEVLRLGRSELGAAPFSRGEAARVFAGVCRRAGRIILVLDLEKILSSEEKISLAGVA
jgi:purine-binding chemotaxis protein CheW